MSDFYGIFIWSVGRTPNYKYMPIYPPTKPRLDFFFVHPWNATSAPH